MSAHRHRQVHWIHLIRSEGATLPFAGVMDDFGNLHPISYTQARPSLIDAAGELNKDLLPIHG